MREIALHILDLIENSIRAQATRIEVAVEALPDGEPAAPPGGLLRIVVEDDGTGLRVPPEAALDPFYTTKRGKRTGLGLSLFKAAAEATGGRLTLEPAGRGTPERPGLRVTAELGLTHVDRSPLGDLAGTLSSVVCTNPEIDFRFRLRLGGAVREIAVGELAARLGLARDDGLVVARHVMRMVREALEASSVLV